MDQNSFNFNTIKLIVGLGNIGKDYQDTRHNAGFIFLDDFSEFPFEIEKKFESSIVAIKIDDQKLLLAKPMTLMNNSGRAVSQIMAYFKIKSEEIVIVHDDLDIELGNWKMQLGKGPHAHNGLDSIEKSINTSNFWRIRIGIDNRSDEQRKNMSGSDYVLERIPKKEMEILHSVNQDILESIFS
jgi:PTH1 family peptidyl-tRNA hydrolase